jgi:hypothetical protein
MPRNHLQPRCSWMLVFLVVVGGWYGRPQLVLQDLSSVTKKLSSRGAVVFVCMRTSTCLRLSSGNVHRGSCRVDSICSRRQGGGSVKQA